MSFDNLLVILLLVLILILFLTWLVIHWNWLPIVLLVVVWFVPRQAVPNGVLEKFIFLRWLTLVLIPLICVIQLFKIYSRGKKFVVPLVIVAPTTMISLIYLLSGIVNNVKVLELLGGLILYLRYPLLFLAFINMDLNTQNIKKFLFVFFILITLQIPECLYRFFVLGISGDFISWTLGPWGHFDLGVYAIYAICLIVAYNCIKGFRLTHLLYCTILLSIALMGEIKGLIFTIPLTTIAIIIYYIGKSRGFRNVLALSVPLIFLFIVYYIFQIWGKVHTSSGNMLLYYFQMITNVLVNPSLMIKPQGLEQTASRFLGSAYVFDYLRNNWQNIILGVGPGSLLAGSFTGSAGKIYNIAMYLNQIAVILGEVGIIGLIAFYWLLYNILNIIRKAYLSVNDSFLKVVALSLTGMWFFYALLGPFYDLVWRHDSPNLIFWFLAAVIYQNTNMDTKVNESDSSKY